MNGDPDNRSPVVAAVFLAALSALLGVLLWAGNALAPASYDTLHQWAGGGSALSNSPVVIVYLDLNSYSLLHQDPTRPWSRGLHAKLLRRLSASGAKAVVFDIVFSDPGEDLQADEEFAIALRQSGKVILAGESSGKISQRTSEDNAWARASKTSPPLTHFATNAAGWGIASHMIDDDYTVRRYLAGGFGAEQQPSLTWAAAQRLGLPITQGPYAMHAANYRGVRYYGPPLAIPHVSYAQALAPMDVPDSFFRDRIVFVGARPITGLFRERQDEFRSPFHSWANKELFMPGVEVHATEMLNLLRNDWLRRPTAFSELIILLLVAIGFGTSLVWLRPIPATLVAVGGAGLAAGLTRISFSSNYWFPWLLVSAVQIPTAWSGAVLHYSVDWYRARKRFEAAKKLADAKIREQAALIDKAHDAILVQNLEGLILYANPSAVRLYGHDLAALKGPGMASKLFLPDAERTQSARATVLQEGEWNGELRQQAAEGRIVTVASRWTLIRDAAGQPHQLLQINSDITDQKLLEQQFLRTQRMNTIGTIAGGMAHDLNNALAPILLGSQLLRRKATDDETRGLLGMMETNTQRGADMVRQVLLFARGRGGEFERLELGGLIKELEKLVSETFPKSITMERYVARDLWAVRGNLTQLHQVLLNLCVNARDAMPRGGRLTLAADNVTLSAHEAAAIPEGVAGDFVSLLVSDTGTGMSPEVRAKIFEPFFTTKGEGQGTGIGLATVLRIMKAHGGFLRVDSTLGQGSAFEIFLPRAVETAASLQTAPSKLPHGSGELLLLAEDEQAMRELMTTELGAHGYRVLAAADGEEAIAKLREHRGEVRLFITDSSMPVLDGLGAVLQARAVRPDLPVIFTSGDVETANQLKATMVIQKPFALEELLQAVHRSLQP